MKKIRLRSIKTKITVWYTMIIVVVFGVILGGMLAYSEYYGESKIRTELLDEVKDLREDILRYSEYLAKLDLVTYYDDGVMLSIYNEKLEKINGIVPEEFPRNMEFVNGETRKMKSEEESWFVNDTKVVMEDGTTFWIRGVHSYSTVMIMFERILMMLVIVIPILIAVTAWVGYRMIRQSLLPVHVITETAQEITSSSELSRRIPLPTQKDEFYELSYMFNEMIERLEENFLRERQFSSDAAHELRTPISVILSHCEYCLEEMEPSEKVADEIRIIQRKTQQMSEMVNDLLTISREERRVGELECEEVDLELIAETVLEELQEKADQRDIQMELRSALENPLIRADMSMITRLFINLVENAITYGKDGGFVKIFMDDMGDRVRLRFQDNGIGIPPEAQNKIWNRFYQVDRSRSQGKGVGLGLFLAQQIVAGHKGTIRVESEKGKGSTFVVELPRE